MAYTSGMGWRLPYTLAYTGSPSISGPREASAATASSDTAYGPDSPDVVKDSNGYEAAGRSQAVKVQEDKKPPTSAAR